MLITSRLHADCMLIAIVPLLLFQLCVSPWAPALALADAGTYRYLAASGMCLMTIPYVYLMNSPYTQSMAEEYPICA